MFAMDTYLSIILYKNKIESRKKGKVYEDCSI